MAIPFVSRAARAFLAGTLALSLGLAPAFAHMAPPPAAAGVHQARGFGHFPRSGFRGFNRFGFNRGFNRFDFDRSGVNRFGLERSFNRFGFNRFGRHGWNGNAWNQNRAGLRRLGLFGRFAVDVGRAVHRPRRRGAAGCDQRLSQRGPRPRRLPRGLRDPPAPV